MESTESSSETVWTEQLPSAAKSDTNEGELKQ